VLTEPPSPGAGRALSLPLALLRSEPFGLPFRSTAAGLTLAKQAAVKSNCSNSTSVLDWAAVEGCLRRRVRMSSSPLARSCGRISWRDLLQAMQLFMPFPPTYGTPFLPERPLVAFQGGDIIDVPIIVGNVRDEAVGFIYGAFGTPVDAKVRVQRALLIRLDYSLR